MARDYVEQGNGPTINAQYIDLFEGSNGLPVQDGNSWIVGRRFLEYGGGRIVIETRRQDLSDLDNGTFHNIPPIFVYGRVGSTEGSPLYTARTMEEMERKTLRTFLIDREMVKKGRFTIE